MLEKFIHIHKRKSDMGNKDNMKRKTTRKRSFRGRSSAVNNDAGKVRNEDAESGQQTAMPEVDGMEVGLILLLPKS